MTASRPAPDAPPLPDARAPESDATRGGSTTLPSSSLLRGRSVVQIEHNGAVYQLRSTRLGKLILTK